ncbi:YgaP-like transmembrane domain [Haloplanus natans]|uniref:YgaP-like transmembrane domain n=1 Tax=Haloplanus natans TaxID=376171 RepID=UPI000677D77E|nr:YgaP-like transmembrane domain [Haloplanus natans]
MDLEQNVGGRDRLARAALAALLTVVAIRSLRAGRRTLGLLAGVGALGFGFNATTCFCGLNGVLGIDTTDGGD